MKYFDQNLITLIVLSYPKANPDILKNRMTNLLRKYIEVLIRENMMKLMKENSYFFGTKSLIANALHAQYIAAQYNSNPILINK